MQIKPLTLVPKKTVLGGVDLNPLGSSALKGAKKHTGPDFLQDFKLKLAEGKHVNNKKSALPQDANKQIIASVESKKKISQEGVAEDKLSDKDIPLDKIAVMPVVNNQPMPVAGNNSSVHVNMQKKPKLERIEVKGSDEHLFRLENSKDVNSSGNMQKKKGTLAFDAQQKVDLVAFSSVQNQAVKNDKREKDPVAVKVEHMVLVTDRRSENSEMQLVKRVDPTLALEQTLKETGNSEIVQRAQFILKDHDAGEIRLTLKPEELGTVRINLTMEDKKVLGYIVVDNIQAKNVFEQNMQDLKYQMMRSGFDTVDLSLSYSGQGHSSDKQQDTAMPYYSSALKEGSPVLTHTEVEAIDTAGYQRNLNLRA